MTGKRSKDVAAVATVDAAAPVAATVTTAAVEVVVVALILT